MNFAIFLHLADLVVQGFLITPLGEDGEAADCRCNCCLCLTPFMLLALASLGSVSLSEVEKIILPLEIAWS